MMNDKTNNSNKTNDSNSGADRYTHFTLTEERLPGGGDRRRVTVSLDVPSRPINVITDEVMHELGRIVTALERRTDVDLVVFRSGKESGFLAGADVATIAEIDSPQEAMHLIIAGQALFQRIQWLPMPTVAVIDGVCLGGGLEWALACTHRIARDTAATQIGLPEIKLGLIPGWGGTQRLPKLVGLRASLEMILTGKSVSAKAAQKIGLIDRAIDPLCWENDCQAFFDSVVLSAKQSRPLRPAVSVRGRLLRWFMDSSLARYATLALTRRQIASKSKHYPALGAALTAIAAGDHVGPRGYQTERDQFVKLLATPTSRRLLELFFARENARKLSTWSSHPSAAVYGEPIRRVGVIGAGAMGAGIAQLAAVRDFDVVVKEIDGASLAAGRKRIKSLTEKLARRQNWDAAKLESTLARVKYSCDAEAIADCDLVIEAVLERDDVKAAVFAEMDRVTRPAAILASNTSSLSVTRMAESTGRPKRVGGLHFFNPVHRMELVEVVQCQDTDDETIGRLVAFVKALGKTPVVTADTPGFLVNRVLFPYLGEAIAMLGEGYRPDQLDRELRRFGMPMGPCELLDQVGLDVAMHVADSLKGVLSGVDRVVDPLRQLVGHGRLGVKAGAGFYDYRSGKRRPSPFITRWIDEQNRRCQCGPCGVPGLASDDPAGRANDESFVDDGMTMIQRRLVYPMLIESIRCHQNRVVRDAWAIDLAMVLGTGMAPHRGGPLHIVDEIGVDRVLENCRGLRRQLGERFAPPEELIFKSGHHERFFETTPPAVPVPARSASKENSHES